MKLGKLSGLQSCQYANVYYYKPDALGLELAMATTPFGVPAEVRFGSTVFLVAVGEIPSFTLAEEDVVFVLEAAVLAAGGVFLAAAADSSGSVFRALMVIGPIISYSA